MTVEWHDMYYSSQAEALAGVFSDYSGLMASDVGRSWLIFCRARG